MYTTNHKPRISPKSWHLHSHSHPSTQQKIIDHASINNSSNNSHTHETTARHLSLMKRRSCPNRHQTVICSLPKINLNSNSNSNSTQNSNNTNNNNNVQNNSQSLSLSLTLSSQRNHSPNKSTSSMSNLNLNSKINHNNHKLEGLSSKKRRHSQMLSSSVYHPKSQSQLIKNNLNTNNSNLECTKLINNARTPKFKTPANSNSSNNAISKQLKIENNAQIVATDVEPTLKRVKLNNITLPITPANTNTNINNKQIPHTQPHHSHSHSRIPPKILHSSSSKPNTIANSITRSSSAATIVLQSVVELEPNTTKKMVTTLAPLTAPKPKSKSKLKTTKPRKRTPKSKSKLKSEKDSDEEFIPRQRRSRKPKAKAAPRAKPKPKKSSTAKRKRQRQPRFLSDDEEEFNYDLNSDLDCTTDAYYSSTFEQNNNSANDTSNIITRDHATEPAGYKRLHWKIRGINTPSHVLMAGVKQLTNSKTKTSSNNSKNTNSNSAKYKCFTRMKKKTKCKIEDDTNLKYYLLNEKQGLRGRLFFENIDLKNLDNSQLRELHQWRQPLSKSNVLEIEHHIPSIIKISSAANKKLNTNSNHSNNNKLIHSAIAQITYNYDIAANIGKEKFKMPKKLILRKDFKIKKSKLKSKSAKKTKMRMKTKKQKHKKTKKCKTKTKHKTKVKPKNKNHNKSNSHKKRDRARRSKQKSSARSSRKKSTTNSKKANKSSNVSNSISNSGCSISSLNPNIPIKTNGVEVDREKLIQMIRFMNKKKLQSQKQSTKRTIT